MLESYKWIGMDGRKSLKGVILRAPLCGANNGVFSSFQLMTGEVLERLTNIRLALALQHVLFHLTFI